MIMSWIWTGFIFVSILCSFFQGTGGALAASVVQGAQAGITLAISMAGSICLWCGAGKLLERSGILGWLSRLLRPLLHRLYPSSQCDPVLAGSLSANICANLLGLGNAATPMGIQAAKRLARGGTTANDELCRLVVMNTASIQLIPATVAAIRVSLGCSTPFDILVPVWFTSLLSVLSGLTAAKFLAGRWCRD